MDKPRLKTDTRVCLEQVILKIPEAFESLLKVRTLPTDPVPPNPRLCFTVLETHHARYLLKEPFQCEVFVCMSSWTSRRMMRLIQANGNHNGLDESRILPGFVGSLLRSAMSMVDPAPHSVKIFSPARNGLDPHTTYSKETAWSISVHSAVGRMDVHIKPGTRIQGPENKQ